MRISTLKLAGMFLALFSMNVLATTRYVDLNCTNATPPFTDWSTAATNIQDAIDAAVDGDLVLVTNGVYANGYRVIYGSARNRVAITKAISVQSVNGAEVTAIAGTTFGSFTRCAYLTNGAMLSGFTLTNGWAQTVGDTVREQSGGGAWCNDASVTISNCFFVGSSAIRYGGGAFQGTVYNSTFTNNSAGFGGGAASNTLFGCILIGNISTYQSPSYGGGIYGVTASNCQIVANHAGATSTGFGGGAAFSVLDSCITSNNTASSGGGLYSCIANYTLISSNRATSSGGGAESCMLSNCILTNNSAGGRGGGASAGTPAAMHNCILIGNTATSKGGGVYGYALVNNCLIVSNSCLPGGSGGGASDCVLYNSTVVGNSSSFNGGIESSGVVPFNPVARNCIIYYNFPGNIAVPATNCCSTPLAAGAGNFTNTPLFANLSTADFHLASNSSCINAGNNSYVTISTDLDGNPRIAGGTVDMGVYEFQSPSSILSYAWAQQYGLPTDGSADFTDPDGDGLNNWQEWIAGTVPTNAASALTMYSPSTNAPGLNVSWQSVSGKTYFLQRSTNLLAQPAFTSIQSNLMGAANLTTYSDLTATNGGPYFYRIGVQ